MSSRTEICFMGSPNRVLAPIHFIEDDRSARIERVHSSSRRKSVTYSTINPTFEVHPNHQKGGDVDDLLRIALYKSMNIFPHLPTISRSNLGGVQDSERNEGGLMRRIS